MHASVGNGIWVMLAGFVVADHDLPVQVHAARSPQRVRDTCADAKSAGSPLGRSNVKDVRVDGDGALRCWNCGTRSLLAKRTFRSKMLVGVGALLTKKKLKCQTCGEYNDTGNAQPFAGPEARKWRKVWEKEQARKSAAPNALSEEVAATIAAHGASSLRLPRRKRPGSQSTTMMISTSRTRPSRRRRPPGVGLPAAVGLPDPSGKRPTALLERRGVDDTRLRRRCAGRRGNALTARGTTIVGRGQRAHVGISLPSTSRSRGGCSSASVASL